jgi:hypothetical protein
MASKKRKKKTAASPVIHVPKKIIKPEDLTDEDLRYLSEDSLALWALTSGAKVDGRDVDFNHHRHLLPIYMCEDQVMAWQKAAQLGATIYMLMRIIHLLVANQGRKAGLYFPTKEGVDNLSKDRVTPLMGSIKALEGLYDPEDKLGLRRLGKSSFYLQHLGGKASKDSVPLDYIAFDEVRLVSSADIYQATERISASKGPGPHKIEMFLSTAGLPGQDINMYYNRGTQHVWQSKCNCPDGCDLARTFPECVVDHSTRGWALQCPKCKYIIVDPQNGRYIPQNPGADYPSFHVSQLASRFMPLKRLMTVYAETTNMEEFFNAKLGLPHIDEMNRGVTMDSLMACVDTELRWRKGTSEDGPCAMGVDQGGGYNMVVIMDWKGGKRRLRHVEIIETTNPDYYVDGKPVTPFVRLGELMKEFNVQMCVLDAMPNANEAMTFAQAFPKRVYLAWYIRDAKDAVTWGDKRKTPEGIQKSGPLMKLKTKVMLSRYMSIARTLGLWRDGEIQSPDPRGLVQMARAEGGDHKNRLQPEAVATRLFDHLCRAIRRERVVNEETMEVKNEWIYAGSDPHLMHACNYCVVALERMGKASAFTFL